MLRQSPIVRSAHDCRCSCAAGQLEQPATTDGRDIVHGQHHTKRARHSGPNMRRYGPERWECASIQSEYRVAKMLASELGARV